MPIEINYKKMNGLDNCSVNSNTSSTSNIGGYQNLAKNNKFPLTNQIINQADNYFYIKRNQVLVSKTDVNKPNNTSKNF